MPSRRQEILDAATRVLGSHGPRGLTHRAVDRDLGLPLGSTANFFGRREELLSALVGHMEQADRRQWENILRGSARALSDSSPPPSCPAELAQMLAELVLTSAHEPMRQVQRARYHLQFARPEETTGTHRRLGEELAVMLDAVGAPRGQAEVLLSLLEGLMLRAVTYGAEVLPPREQISTALEQLMRQAGPVSVSRPSAASAGPDPRLQPLFDGMP